MKQKLLSDLKTAYLNNLKIDNYSSSTITHVSHHLKKLIYYLSEFHNVYSPEQITKQHFEGYVDYIKKLKSKNTGKHLVESTINGMCSDVKKFCDYLLEKEYLSVDYFVVFEIRWKKQGIPRNILTEKQVLKVLSLPDEKTYLGFRDKVMLELMYNTGIRRMEVTGLDVYDINFEEKTLFIELGKGKKDRLVPFGEYLERYLRVYVEDVRPALIESVDETKLFCNNKGLPMSPNNLNVIISGYRKMTDFHFSCHTFRHSMATHMLKHGADILYIQRILGHENASTTQIYTKVYPLDLKKVILEMHPRSNIKISEEEIILPIKKRSPQRKYLKKN
jgi:integrase/recombinase XerD